ncbi:hypothetical protein Scep_010171 [Stephania cephalantha]|uniref:Uncharacterized protein n=1 Tax=Stephania cephalantha TaxID=152367 RepID=A0AAP0JWS3_9MAGN
MVRSSIEVRFGRKEGEIVVVVIVVVALDNEVHFALTRKSRSAKIFWKLRYKGRK